MAEQSQNDVAVSLDTVEDAALHGMVVAHVAARHPERLAVASAPQSRLHFEQRINRQQPVR